MLITKAKYDLIKKYFSTLFGRGIKYLIIDNDNISNDFIYTNIDLNSIRKDLYKVDDALHRLTFKHDITDEEYAQLCEIFPIIKDHMLFLDINEIMKHLNKFNKGLRMLSLTSKDNYCGNTRFDLHGKDVMLFVDDNLTYDNVEKFINEENDINKLTADAYNELFKKYVYYETPFVKCGELISEYDLEKYNRLMLKSIEKIENENVFKNGTMMFPVNINEIDRTNLSFIECALPDTEFKIPVIDGTNIININGFVKKLKTEYDLTLILYKFDNAFRYVIIFEDNNIHITSFMHKIIFFNRKEKK